MSQENTKIQHIKKVGLPSSLSLNPESLFTLTSHIKFFQKITEDNNSTEIHKQCCEVMTLETYQKNGTVINYGDIGDKFYIILSGSASIYIPTKKKIQMTVKELKSYRKKFNSSSSESSSSSSSSSSKSSKESQKKEKPEKIEKPEKKNLPVIIHIKDILFQFNEPNASNDSTETDEVLIQKLFKKKLIKGKKDVFKLSKEDNQNVVEIEVNRMEEAGVFKEGDSFGELALISNRPRAATVIAREKLTLLVLKKSQFKSILGSLSEKKAAVHLKFLQSLPYFSGYSNTSLSKLAYLFQILHFSHKQVLFTQDQATTGLYLIKEGEFILTQKYYKVISDTNYSFDKTRERHSDKWIKLPKIKKDLKVIIKGKNESVGGYEVVNHKPHRMFSCTCISTKAEVYFLPTEHFWTKIPGIDQIKAIIETENARLITRLSQINDISEPVLPKEVPIDLRSKRQLQNLRSSPKHSTKNLSSSRINSLQLNQKPIKNEYLPLETLKINNLPQSPKRPKPFFFHQLTEEEIFQAVNGRFNSRIDIPQRNKSFLQSRSPPKSFLQNYRKYN